MTRYGDRAFSVIAPTLWHKLPTHIQAAPSLNNQNPFKPQLKTHLFCQSGYSVQKHPYLALYKRCNYLFIIIE